MNKKRISFSISGALTISSTLGAEEKKNETAVAKDKRQIDRDTVVIGGNGRAYSSYPGSHLYPQPQEAQDIPNYVTPIPRQGKAQHYRAPPQQQTIAEVSRLCKFARARINDLAYRVATKLTSISTFDPNKWQTNSH